MYEEDLKDAKCVDDILIKDIRAELKKIKDAGSFTPGQTKTLNDALELMLNLKEFEGWLEGEAEGYSQRRNPMNGQYMRGSYDSYGYPMRRSGHSTRDRMISALEDLMGEAKNEYEARMIRDTIRYVQDGEGR